MQKLLVASTNQKKLKELQELLTDLPIELLSLQDFPNISEVEEDGLNFKENAEKKALGYAKQTSCLTLGEDSGLVVDALNGAPGILSARFSGKGDLENCQKVLNLMKGISREKRTAQFRSACALATPEKIIGVVEDEVSGFIAEEMIGSGGFGYDPLFFYPDFGTTFASVSAERKHSVSHRGKALQKIIEVLRNYLQTLAI